MTILEDSIKFNLCIYNFAHKETKVCDMDYQCDYCEEKDMFYHVVKETLKEIKRIDNDNSSRDSKENVMHISSLSNCTNSM